MIKNYESFLGFFKKSQRKNLDKIFEEDLDKIKDCFLFISDGGFDIKYNGLNFNEKEKHKWIRIDINKIFNYSFSKYNLTDADIDNIGFDISTIDDDIKQAISYLKEELDIEVKQVLVDAIDYFKKYSHYRSEIKTLEYSNYDMFLSEKVGYSRGKIFNIALCFK